MWLLYDWGPTTKTIEKTTNNKQQQQQQTTEKHTKNQVLQTIMHVTMWDYSLQNVGVFVFVFLNCLLVFLCCFFVFSMFFAGGLQLTKQPLETTYLIVCNTLLILLFWFSQWCCYLKLYRARPGSEKDISSQDLANCK